MPTWNPRTEILAAARRWLNASGQLLPELVAAERARRVDIYRRQLERTGRIEYITAPTRRLRTRYRSRFAFGDAQGRH